MEIDFDNGFKFAFGNSWFHEDETNIAGMGWELTRGRLLYSRLQEVFPQTEFCFLPLSDSTLQSAFLADSLRLKTSPEKILVDFPSQVNSHLHALCTTQPPMALVSANFVAGDPLPDEKIFFFEALNAKRRFLSSLLQHEPTNKNKILCAGGESVNLKFLLSSSKRSVPGECLLESGLFPYFQLCSQAQIPLSPEWYEDFTTQIVNNGLQGAGSVLIVVTDLLLGSLGKALEIKLREGFENDNTIPFRKTNSVHWQLATVSEENNAEYSTLPGFVCCDFFTDKNSNTWQELYRQSFLSAFKRAQNRYTEWTKLGINDSQLKNYFNFVYKLAATNGDITPRSFDILLAAQSCIDSNFSFELLTECRTYPGTEKSVSFPKIHIPLQHLFKNVSTLSIKRFETLQKQKSKAFKLTSAHKQQKPINRKVEPVSEEKYADNSWATSNHPYYCSFPEEDIFMENFAFEYRKHAHDLVKSKETIIREMQSSLGDGLDIRETVRNWHKQALMIKEEMTTGKADVGAVIFDFTEPGTDDKYSWKSFWLAENHDNSNLMFCATPFGDNLIGPGIAKSEFGGFAVIPIPSYTGNPWEEWFIYTNADTNAEALLLAGALATSHKSVLYLAKHPPTKKVVRLLKQSGKFIIYLNINELPSDKVRKVRTFHILAEPGVRQYAEKYIRKE